MNKEEKEAVAHLKWLLDDGILSSEDEPQINIVLNLIEKQSKEIEDNKKYIVQLTDEQYRKLVDIIRGEISKEWRDKIKAKIEEIDIEIQCCEYADDDTEEYKQDIEKEKRRLLRDKAVLQSLLEKE